jgi:hypothetical protein
MITQQLNCVIHTKQDAYATPQTQSGNQNSFSVLKGLRTRHGKRLESVPSAVMEEVLARLAPIFL